MIKHPSTSMNYNHITGRILLFSSYFLNIPVWMSHLPFAFKIALAFIAGLTTVMAFLNQWITFRKNYRTMWVVVTIEHVFTFLRPKKNRHRGISLTKKTKKDEPIS